MKTSLTGIKPTGSAHLGNLIGSIRPALELAKTHHSLLFIADYHAFTTEHDPKALRAQIHDLAATWLACGIDPKTTLFYRQSSVVEVFELMWVFECLIATGQLERGHAYKDALAKGESPNAGVFNYPVLMAADIVLYDADVVPVGRDQKQHVEVARDVAVRLNHLFGEGTVVVPEPRIEVPIMVPGVDGRKMGKSNDNAISIFSSAKALRQSVMKIVTGSEPLEAPKEPEGSTVFQIFASIASESDVQTMAEKLRAGGYGWGHAKQALADVLEAELAPRRPIYEELVRDTAKLDAILEDGATRARAIAKATIGRVRAAIGID